MIQTYSVVQHAESIIIVTVPCDHGRFLYVLDSCFIVYGFVGHMRFSEVTVCHKIKQKELNKLVTIVHFQQFP